MEILILIVALLLVGGVSSALHGIIKPAVERVYPPVSTGHRAWALLVEEGERIEREILAMQHKPSKAPTTRSFPDGARAVMRLLEEQAKTTLPSR